VPAPIALQLYTVRDDLATDFAGVLQRIAHMGYVGVETAGFPKGTTASMARRLFDDLGLTVCSAHTPLPLGDRKNEALDLAAQLGCRRIVSGLGPEDFTTPDVIRHSCDRLNQANVIARENGLTFLMHNHGWEYQRLPDGRRVDEVMLTHLDSTLLFELDIYWVQTGGADPMEVVRALGSRALLLHVKDGPAVVGLPMTAVGEGTLDVPSILRASEGSAEWLIVELDACATDMLEAVEKSYRYLISRGLARGNKN
jgi:sugar phosphate isomerase/epimerase